ncbi:MAG: flippase-like domain-containing protein, partial [bacterium]|nr:flippase-like domain-containing protein [bacterium]
MIVTVAVAAVLAYRWNDLGFEWQRFTSTFRHISWPWMALSGVLALLTYLGRALRWRVLIRPVREKPSLWNLFSATAIGFTAIVLFGRAGELVRPFLISAKEKVSFSSQVAAWFIERIYDLLTALLIFGFALSRV